MTCDDTKHNIGYNNKWREWAYAWLWRTHLQVAETLDELDALVVLAAHEGVLGDLQVERLQWRLGQQAPAATIGAGVKHTPHSQPSLGSNITGMCINPSMCAINLTYWVLNMIWFFLLQISCTILLPSTGWENCSLIYIIWISYSYKWEPLRCKDVCSCMYMYNYVHVVVIADIHVWCHPPQPRVWVHVTYHSRRWGFMSPTTVEGEDACHLPEPRVRIHATYQSRGWGFSSMNDWVSSKPTLSSSSRVSRSDYERHATETAKI